MLPNGQSEAEQEKRMQHCQGYKSNRTGKCIILDNQMELVGLVSTPTKENTQKKRSEKDTQVWSNKQGQTNNFCVASFDMRNP